jgi:hypothetical protein
MTVHTATWRAVRDVEDTWHPYHTWQADVAGRQCGRVTVQVGDVGECLAATWPSHGLPCGSGQMPNEGQLPEIQN